MVFVAVVQLLSVANGLTSYPPGPATLSPSQSGTLLVLSRVGVNDASAPVARSYDGHAWELTQGGVAQRVQLTCDDTSTCVAQIPLTYDGSAYHLQTYQGPAMTSEKAAARFLLQATFGPTRATLPTVDATSQAGLKTWLDTQMGLPGTLHREYYRKRANPRTHDHSLPTGGVRSACRSGSRWHRFAFTKADEGRTMHVGQSATGGSMTLSIGGTLRAEVAAFDVASFGAPPATYTLC